MKTLWIVLQYKEADHGPDYESIASIWPTKDEAINSCAALLGAAMQAGGFYRPEYEVAEYEIGRDYVANPRT